MARFVGKTFESLNSMLNNTGLFLNIQDKSSTKIIPWTVDSKSFFRKLKNVDSKQAEEEVIRSHLTAFEKRLSEPDVPNSEIEDIIKMCMTCETMGYPTPFIYVHCLKLAQKGSLQEKHTGYSAASFFLHPHHELVILLINTMQKDLCSSNFMEVLFALSSVCNLINVENVQNILHLVQEKLKHEKSSVRKSAILTLGHCLNLIDSQSAYQMSIQKLEKALTDSELEVVAAAVCTIYKIIQKLLPCDFSYLIKSLVELQDQILLRRVPRSMIYCDIPAPWLQLDILRLLNLLSKQPEHYQEVTPVLKKTLQQVGLQNTIAHAIMYQVIEIITNVQPCTELVEIVLSSISVFLKSKSINLKLTGIESLVLVVKRLKPSITAAQQEIIMECLRLPDDTLQLKTLELLYHLANPSNVQAICKKLMEFLNASRNVDKQKELALKVLELAKMFLDRHEWFVSASLSVLMDAGHLLPDPDIYNIIDIVSKDDILRETAKNACLDICRNGNNIPSSVIKLTVAVLSTSKEFEEVFLLLEPTMDDEAATWLLVSLTEVVLKTKQISANFVTFLKNIRTSHSYASEVLKELLEIVENISQLKDAKLDEIQVDPSLTFLDAFVVNALENSVSSYLPSSFRLATVSIDETADNLKTSTFSCSEISFAQDSINSPSLKSPTYSEFSSPSTSFQSLTTDKDVQSCVPKARSVWTVEGRKNLTNEESNSDIEKTKSTEEGDDLKDLFAGIS